MKKLNAMMTEKEMETTAMKMEAVMKGLARATMVVSMIMFGSNGLTHATGKGTSGAQFLRIGVGARSPGMAGALSPIVDDVTAIHDNPAGLARMDKREVQLSYNAYFKDTSSQFLGYAHPTENHGAFGLGISMFGVKDIDKRSATGGDADTPDLGKFDTRDMAASLAWANKLALGNGRLHYGAALKYISSDLNTDKAATGAIDMGAMWDLREDGGLTFALSVLNLGGQLKFAEEGDPLPLDIKPGVAYRMKFERAGQLALAVDSDILVHDGVSYVQPGIEWAPMPMFALRTGYQFGRDNGAGSGFAAGAGFRLMNIGIDYAFVPFGDLGDTHRVSLGYRFGGEFAGSMRGEAEAPSHTNANGRQVLGIE